MKTPTLFEKRHNKKYNDVIEACKLNNSMVLAAKSVNIPYKTFIRIAKKLGCYKPNQGGKGLPGISPKTTIPLEDILDGKFPQYQTNKLRSRLIKSGLKKYECEICKLKEWNGLPIPLELDHIDGNNSNHKLHNLRIICPNCHHQTENHSCKKK